MRSRTVAATGDRVSEISLGCWQIGAEWGPVPDERARAVVHAALDSGITFFDTADVYGRGRSERLLGEVLGARDDVFVATKIGRFPEPGWPDNFTRPVVERHVDASLRRLRRERLDLVQLHCVPPELLRRGELFDWLATLHERGKLRAFGASVESTDDALFCVEDGRVAALQIICNVFRQHPVRALFGRAADRGVALIVRLPLASGLLAGRFTRDTVFPADDHRRFNRDGAAFHVGETFAGIPFERGVELVEELRAIAPPGLALADLAQRWLLDHPAVTTVITGASRPDQAARNAAVSALPPLPAALHDRLGRFFDEHVAAHVRGGV